MHTRQANQRHDSYRLAIWPLVSCLLIGLAVLPGRGENNSNYVFNGTTTNFGGSFTVGNSGTNNFLSISNGGAVTNTSGTVGSSGSNNSALVTGGNSLWYNSSSLSIGAGTESGNQLSVTNGGLVISSGGGFIGFDTTSFSNSVFVTGSGSAWTNGASDLYIGRSGAAGSLTIANSGQVFNANSYIGANASASNNAVTVMGAASLWRNASDLYVGQSGVGGQLIITNGGTVISAHGYVAYNSASSNNVVVVSETGSLWSNTSSLTVGRLGQSNKLTVANGARVTSVGIAVGNSGATNNQMVILNGGVMSSSGDAIVGQVASSLSNSVVVSGIGSVWTNGANTLYMGEAGAGNSMTISNQGIVYNGAGYVGYNTSGSNNTVTVTGSGSVWSNTSTLVVGNDGSGNRLTISNGASVYNNTYAYLGFNSLGASNNIVVVTDSNSVWNTGTVNFGVGRSSPGNQLIVTNGALVIAGTAYIGSSAGAAGGYSNTVTVTGSGSVFSNSTLDVGNYGYGNQLTVSTSGHVYTATLSVGGSGAGGQTGYGNTLLITSGGRVDSLSSYVAIGDGGLATSNNQIIVTGSNSILNVAGNLHIDRFGSGNQLIITNGGLVVSGTSYMGNNGGNNGLVMVTGPGSIWSNATSSITVGVSGSGHRVVVSDGGKVVANSVSVGSNAGATNNSIIITGNGSLMQSASSVTVANTGSVLVADGGTLEASTLSSGVGSTISNVNGVYQFASSSPTITASTPGNIVLSNGTISFRGITDADVFGNVIGAANQLTNIAFTGGNAFRLYGSSNRNDIAQNYTFDSGRGATNYARLELLNAGALWRSANLTFGSGGSFLASNTVGTVAASVISTGTIEVVKSVMTWSSNVVIYGSYKSDPSTNIFNADLTIAQSGTLSGGLGDRFEFSNSSFIIHATNNVGFNIASSSVAFTGGRMHTNAITGVDLGSNALAYAVAFEVQTNFAYGELHLGSVTDQVCFTCGAIPAPGVTNNALYVGWLDLLGDATLVTNLHAASGINIYYNETDSRNAYLNNLTYQLTDCDLVANGGLLIPVIPEPSTLLLIAIAAGFIRRHRSS